MTANRPLRHLTEAFEAQVLFSFQASERSWWRAGLASLFRRFGRPVVMRLKRPPKSLSKKAQALRTSELFDETWYRERYPDVAASGVDPVRHYLRYGASEGRDPGPAFDSLWYLGANPDVAKAGINPLYHYIIAGKNEGRVPSDEARALRASGLFDETWYRERYPDVVAAGMDPVLHYLSHGASEGRDPGPAFDSSWYLEANPDVAQAGVNPLYHYIITGKNEGRAPSDEARAIRASGLFDEAWYRERYPDVVAAGMDPVLHYLHHGASEGRDPGPAFDSLWYLEANPDVARAGVNPLYHYISAGKNEGRTPQPLPGVVRTSGPAGDAKSASIDEAARSRFEDSAIRSMIQQLFEIADPTIAEVLALNSDAWSAIANRPRNKQAPLTIVVTHNEISNAHGTGILVKRLFGDTPAVVTIRSGSSFDGRDEIGFANVSLGNKMLSDQQLYRLFSFLLAGQRVRAVVCIPYDDLDLRAGLRVAEVLSAPFVLYTMDDNNVIGQRISDYTMERAVRFAALRLVISTEMRQAYEAKFRAKFFVLPPLVPPELLSEEALLDSVTGQRGIIVGNIWRQSWLDEILDVTGDSGIELDWICNTSNPAWLRFDRKEIAERGIHFVDPLPESQLVDRIRNSPFCLLPSAVGNEDSSTSAIARLSLPSRVVLVVAACQTPIIIVGDSTTAAARFVLRFGVGVVARYKPDELKQAVATVLDPAARRQMRDNALAIAGQFSSQGIADWLFRSIDAGQAIDDRFEHLLATAPGEISMFIDRPFPDSVDPDRSDVFRALRRLKGRGFNPDFIIDAGASDGVWSRAIVQLFPEARFLLVEPLLSRYRARSSLRSTEAHPNFELIEVALLDKEGQVEMQVSGDIYNSSTLGVRLTGMEERIKVPAVTLDALVRTRDLRGRGLLKIDVQYAEHLVLDGAKNLLQNNLDAVIVEMTLRREHPDSYTFIEICNKMRHLGFDYEDDVGEWRSPIDGRLEQKDGLFVRQNSALG